MSAERIVHYLSERRRRGGEGGRDGGRQRARERAYTRACVIVRYRRAAELSVRQS